MKVRIKLIEDGIMPIKMHETDAGFDCYARSKKQLKNGKIMYELGFSIEIPRGYAAFMFPRSSIFDYDMSLTNCVGVIDSGYRGEVKAVFRVEGDYALPNGENPNLYNVGDRVCQMIIMPYPEIELVETDTLSDSDRGTGGFGSTGKNKADVRMPVAFDDGKREIEDFDGWKRGIMEFVEKCPSEWRRGQSVFNTLESIYGDIVRKVCFEQHIDCFYDDKRTDDFLIAVFDALVRGNDHETKNPLF